MALQKLTPNCMVDDMAGTVAFYRDVLGFEVALSVPETPPFNWAMLRSGGAALMFQTRESLAGEVALFRDMPVGGSLGFYMHTDEVRGLYERVKGRAELVQDLHDTFYGATEFSIRDPNGYILVFAQHGGGAS
jgi:uncharacterized glyoxalase superfamily protein PhnB